MKTLKNSSLALLVFLVAVSTAGCFDEITSSEYDDDPVVQFEPNLSGTVLDTDGQVSIGVALIASEYPPAEVGGDITVPVTVVDSQTTVSDDNFELLTPTVTIPADSVFANDVVIDIMNTGIAPGEDGQVVLALNESEDGAVTPAANFQTFTLNIVGETASILTDPTSVAFDSVGTDSVATETIDITNQLSGLAGTLESEVGNFEIVGDDEDVFDFTVSSGDESGLDQTVLASDESAQVVIQFAPDAAADYQAQFTFDFTNDPAADNVAVGLTGTGVDPDDGDDSDDGS